MRRNTLGVVDIPNQGVTANRKIIFEFLVKPGLLWPQMYITQIFYISKQLSLRNARF